MKICEKCGVEIINGVNGCMMMGNICDKCGDWPNYGPSGVAAPRRYTDIPDDYLNYIESCFLPDDD